MFTTRLRTPLDPGNLLHDFKRILKKAGLPGTRFHDLRHGAEPIAGFQRSPQVIVELLGHSQMSMTMSTYSHASDVVRDAVNEFGATLK